MSLALLGIPGNIVIQICALPTTGNMYSLTLYHNNMTTCAREGNSVAIDNYKDGVVRLERKRRPVALETDKLTRRPLLEPANMIM